MIIKNKGDEIMKNNNKIAKELLRIAKELIGVNQFQQFSDSNWFHINSMDQQQFIKLLQKYIQLRRLFFYLLNNQSNMNEREYAQKKVRTALIIKQLQNISIEESMDKIDEEIEFLDKEGEKHGNYQDFLRKIQDSISKLISTKRKLYVAYNAKSGLQVIMIDKAYGLLSRLSDIIHSINIKKANITGVVPTRNEDDLLSLFRMFKYKGVKFDPNLGRVRGDANMGIFIQNNLKKQRLRIKQATESLDKINDEMKPEGKQEDVYNNIHTYLLDYYSYIQGRSSQILGYFSTVNTSVLSTVYERRKGEGAMQINKDLGDTLFSEIIDTETDFEGLKKILIEKVVNNSTQKEALFKLIDLLSDNNKRFIYKVITNEEEINEIEYNKFISNLNKRSSTLNASQKLLLTCIKQKLPKFYERLKEIEESDMGSLKKVDLTIEQLDAFYGDNESYKQLSEEQKIILLNWINDHKKQIINYRTASKKSNAKIAGFNIENIINNVSSFFTNVKQKLGELYNKIVGNKQVQEDDKKLEELIQEENDFINRQKSIIDLINQTDNSLIEFYNNIKNFETNEGFEQMDRAASRKKMK